MNHPKSHKGHHVHPDDPDMLSVEEAQKEIMNLRFRAATMQLTNVNEIGAVRKKIARIMTVIREREILRDN